MRAIFDYFAKRVVQTAVAPACVNSSTEHEVHHDPQRADLFIEPDPKRVASLAPFGMLGRFCRRVCVLEFFHGTPGLMHVEACILKILALRSERRRKKLSEPIQWIIVSGVPRTALRELGFRRAPGFGPGVYRTLPRFATYLAVAGELPPTRDTLLLRLLAGRGSVLTRARAELLELPDGAPERFLAVPIMVELWPDLEGARAQQWRYSEEFLMMVHPVIEFWKKKWEEQQREAAERGLAEGIETGLERGLAGSLIGVYEARFGAVPKSVSSAVARVHDPAVLRGWVALFATARAEEIAKALRAAKPAAKKRAARTTKSGGARARRRGAKA